MNQYTLFAPTLNIQLTFDSKEQAYSTAELIAKDYPMTAIFIQRAYFDSWQDVNANQIQEFESVSDEMAINRRLALASLLQDPNTIVQSEFGQEVIASIDTCLAYYGELMQMLNTAKHRLEVQA